MAKLLIQSMGCPNCGAPYEPKTRICRFCNSVLIVTSLAETFERSFAAHQVAGSLEKWRQRLKDDPDSAEAHFALGLSYLNSKLRDAALVHLRKAVILAPEVADTHHNLALTLLNDGNIDVTSPEYAEAVKEIDYSVQLAPDVRLFSHARTVSITRVCASRPRTPTMSTAHRAVAAAAAAAARASRNSAAACGQPRRAG